MKSLIRPPRVNAALKNKRFLAEPIGPKRINSLKRGPRRHEYFFAFAEAVAYAGEAATLGGGLAVEPVHLALHELPVQALAPDQQIGWPVLNDFAKLHDDDTVETSYRR